MLKKPWADDVLARMDGLDASVLQRWSDLLAYTSQPGRAMDDVHNKELEFIRR
jgi:hypothetical protein